MTTAGPRGQPGSLAEQAYRLLEAKLVTLELAPGALVAEKDLVDRVGIGRTPVREAIQRLSAEGLLQVLPRKGLVVTPLLRSDLLQIIEVRRVLERLMVVKAAERAGELDAGGLRRTGLRACAPCPSSKIPGTTAAPTVRPVKPCITMTPCRPRPISASPPGPTTSRCSGRTSHSPR